MRRLNLGRNPDITSFRLNDIEDNGTLSMDFVCRSEDIGIEIDEVEFPGMITVHVQAFRQGNSVFARVDARFTVVQSCRRCLEPFEEDLSAHFELQYLPIAPDEEIDEYEDEIAGISRYVDERIDIAEDLRGSIVVNVPLWPVCDDNCRGLCPHCGINLNESSCNCEIEIRRKNSKFAVLADMIKTISG